MCGGCGWTGAIAAAGMLGESNEGGTKPLEVSKRKIPSKEEDNQESLVELEKEFKEWNENGKTGW